MTRVHYSKESQYFAIARYRVFGFPHEYPDASRRLCSSKDLSIEDQHKERVERKSNFHLELTTGKYPPAKPGALGLGPLEAAEGVADAAP